MKLLISYVTYNPNEVFLKRLKKNISQNKEFEFFVFDNTEVENNELKHLTSIHYYTENTNKGIAYALNFVMNFAIANGFDYVLTLDQDSEIDFGLIEKSFKKVILHQEYGILSLNYNAKYKNDKAISNEKYLITSGSFVNVSKYKLIDGFNSKLFIDYVDFDLCRQFKNKNVPLGVLTEFSFKHTIGNPIVKKFLFIKVKALNHKPVRYYYRYRNELYCYKKDRRFFFKTHIKEMIQIIIMILLEKDKVKKLKMIHLGRKDCRKGVFGKFNGKI